MTFRISDKTLSKEYSKYNYQDNICYIGGQRQDLDLSTVKSTDAGCRAGVFCLTAFQSVSLSSEPRSESVNGLLGAKLIFCL